MTNKIVNTTIEILNKLYPVRCLESEISSLQQAAALLDQEMAKVQDSGKAINLERIAIITALNMTHQFLQLSEQKNNLTDQVNQRLSQLQDKLDRAINKTVLAELGYTTK